MADTMNRRRFLQFSAVLGTGATAVLSGCSTAVASVPAPAVPDTTLEEDGWRQYDQRRRTVLEQRIAGTTVEAKAHTLAYENAELRNRVERETLGTIDTRLAVFSASRVEVGANLDDLPGMQTEVLGRVERAARDRFESRLDRTGVTNTKTVDAGKLAIETGESASLTGVTGELPIEPIEFEVRDGRSIELPLETVSIGGLIAVWHHDGYVLIGGGAYPAEPVQTTIEKDLSRGIEVRLDIDLELRPEDYRASLRELIASIT